jgi:hypothetical protein
MSDGRNIQEKRKWSSAKVAMSLLSVGGALSISACEPPQSSADIANQERRNQYQTQAECVADYSEKECEPQSRSGGGFFFLGPMYGGNWRSRGASAFAGGGGPGRAALASPNGVVAHPTQTTRGGFGSTGRSYSSRGS